MAEAAQAVLYLVDLVGCERMSALAPEAVHQAFVSTLERAGATVIQAAYHPFPGAGLTSVLILAESHAVLHTWPETATANVDIFSCSSRLASRAAIAEIGELFGARQVTVQEVSRADGRRPHAEPCH